MKANSGIPLASSVSKRSMTDNVKLKGQREDKTRFLTNVNTQCFAIWGARFKTFKSLCAQSQTAYYFLWP